MPFYHDGTFRLFYLQDEQHHGALGGLGGHQWAQASTNDLHNWKHHPLAIPITEDFEGSICTGSVLFFEGTYYGFYATRLRNRTQHLGLAVSTDGIHFQKTLPNPFASPPSGYNPYHYRDPFVYQDCDEGRFHLLVTAMRDDWSIPDRGGCLAHLISDNLRQWEILDPLLIPGLPGVPECPDYFTWHDWTYLIFSNNGVARYRMSRKPFGPWHRPNVDALDGPASRVMKTAAFTDDRRIGVAWIGTREDNKDNGRYQFGGNAVFREFIQNNDGTLNTRLPSELLPAGKRISNLHFSALDPVTHFREKHIVISSKQGLGACLCSGLSHNVYMKLRVLPQLGAAVFGIQLRAQDTFDTGYNLHFAPQEETVKLNEQQLFGVNELNQPFEL